MSLFDPIAVVLLETWFECSIMQAMLDPYNPARDLGAVVYRLPVPDDAKLVVEKVSSERWRPEFHIRGGDRPNWALLLIRSGQLRLCFDDEEWQPVGPGELCILAPGRRQELRQTGHGGVSCFRVALAGRGVARLLRQYLGADHGRFPSSPAAEEQVLAMLRLLGSRGHSAPVPALLLAHVELLLRYAQAARLPGFVRNDSSGLLRAAVAGHCFQADPVQAAARECGVSLAHFSRRYRKLCGESPRRSVDRLRCQEAQELLTDGVLSLAAIAEQLGYADVFSFSKAFRRWTGVAPSRWLRSED